MITLEVQDKRLRDAMDLAARKYPAIAEDAMSRAMLGLRKSWLKDLRPRYPRLAMGRAQYQFWQVRVFRSQGGNVIGKFQPRGENFRRNLSLLEFGGTVRPKHADALAIPAPAARSKSGKVRKGYKSPTQWYLGGKGRRLVMLKKGNRAWLARKTKKGHGPILFTLKKSITFRPTLGLFAYWAQPFTRRQFLERIEKNLVRDLGGIFGPGTFRRTG